MRKFGEQMSKKLSSGAEKIRKLLLKNNINFTIEKTFPDLKSSKGKPLRFDFAVYDNNWKNLLLIEYHYQESFLTLTSFFTLVELFI